MNIKDSERKERLTGVLLVLSAALLAVFLVLLLLPVDVFAEEDEATLFSVTIPTTLPVEVDAEGNVVTADNLTITNNASGPIAVSKLRITPVGGWSLCDYSTDFSAEPVDLKSYGLAIGGKAVSGTGDADLSGIPFIGAHSSATIAYSANVAVQSRDIKQEVIGDLEITVAWQPGQLYSIEVTGNPSKTVYFAGEAFDPSGMEVTAVFYGGERRAVTDYVIADGTALPAGKTGVTVVYAPSGTKSASTVVPVRVVKKLTGLSVASQPVKTVYNHNETFSTAGLLVRADYADGSSGYVGTYSIEPRTLSYGTDHVTVSYSENGVTKTATIPVSVRREIASLEVTKAPDRTEYRHGDVFDPSGAVVTVTYTDGGSAEVTGSVVWSRTVVEYTNTGVSCSYSENGRTLTDGTGITVRRVLSGISHIGTLQKTVYEEGEAFSPKGVSVRAAYTDGGTEEITAYTWEPKNLSAGTEKVTLSYTENGITCSCTVPVTVNAAQRELSGADISLERTVEYYDGSARCPAVSVSWNGTPLREGTDYTVSYLNNVNPGQASVTVTGTGNYTGTETLPFTVKVLLRVNWTGTQFVCNNTVPCPSAELTGLFGTDTAKLNVTGGGKASPGTYRARADVTVNSALSDYYEIANTECSYTIAPGASVPVLRAGSLKAPFETAGLPANSIAAVEFRSCYDPTGEELAAYTLCIDEGGTGEIKGYILQLGAYNSSARYKLIVSGNGSASIRANANSERLLYYLVNRYDEDGKYGTITGLELLDFSGVTNARYMFANLTADSMVLKGLKLDSATTLAYMFSGAKFNSLTLSGWQCPACTDMSYLFQRATITQAADLSGLDTSHVLTLSCAFLNATMPETLNLNGWNVSSLTVSNRMFENLKGTVRLLVSAWDVSRLTTTENMFEKTAVLKSLNISTWDLSSVTSMSYMFYNSSIETLYTGNRTGNCRDFAFMFSSESCCISTIYSTGDWDLSSSKNLYQKCFTGNVHFTNSSMITVSMLKLEDNGGILQYHEAFSD